MRKQNRIDPALRRRKKLCNIQHRPLCCDKTEIISHHTTDGLKDSDSAAHARCFLQRQKTTRHRSIVENQHHDIVTRCRYGTSVTMTHEGTAKVSLLQ
jgi:hypothetical protein